MDFPTVVTNLQHVSVVLLQLWVSCSWLALDLSATHWFSFWRAPEEGQEAVACTFFLLFLLVEYSDV